jgi:hypothetical protein
MMAFKKQKESAPGRSAVLSAHRYRIGEAIPRAGCFFLLKFRFEAKKLRLSLFSSEVVLVHILTSSDKRHADEQFHALAIWSTSTRYNRKGPTVETCALSKLNSRDFLHAMQ